MDRYEINNSAEEDFGKWMHELYLEIEAALNKCFRNNNIRKPLNCAFKCLTCIIRIPKF
jgi:hypothetical protein